MSKEYSTDKVTRHKQIAIEKLDTFLNDCIENDLPKADKLSYWISDYAGYLKSEKTFLPGKLKRYKRGDIVKVNFGFRLGSELGGRHYCVVLDKDNSPKAPTITVMPLTSLKENTDINKLPKDRIYLGSEIYTEVLKKQIKY